MEVNLKTLSQLPKDNPTQDYSIVGGKGDDQLTTITIKKLGDFLAANSNAMQKSDYAYTEDGVISPNKVSQAQNSIMLNGATVGENAGQIPKYTNNATIITGVATTSNEAVRFSQLLEVAATVDKKIPLNRISENSTSSLETLPTLGIVKEIVGDIGVSNSHYRGIYLLNGISIYPNSGGSGVNGAIVKNDFWVTGDDIITNNGVVFKKGSIITALVDNPSNSTHDNWAVTKAIGFLNVEDLDNKVYTLDNPNNTNYPTTKAVADKINYEKTDVWDVLINSGGKILEYCVKNNLLKVVGRNLVGQSGIFEATIPPLSGGKEYSQTAFITTVGNNFGKFDGSKISVTLSNSPSSPFYFSFVTPVVDAVYLIKDPVIIKSNTTKNSIEIFVELGNKNHTYDVYLDNSRIAQAQISQTYTATGLLPNKSYSIYINENLLSGGVAKSNVLNVLTDQEVQPPQNEYPAVFYNSFKIKAKVSTGIGIEMFGSGGNIPYITSDKIAAGTYTAAGGGGGYSYTPYWGLNVDDFTIFKFTEAGVEMLVKNNETTVYRYAGNGGNASTGGGGGNGGVATNQSYYGENGEGASSSIKPIGGKNGKKIINGYGKGADGILSVGENIPFTFGEAGAVAILLEDVAESEWAAEFERRFEITML